MLTFYEWNYICELIDLLEYNSKMVHDLETARSFFSLIDDYLISTHIHEYKQHEQLKKSEPPYWPVEESPRKVMNVNPVSSLYVPSIKELYNALTFHEDKSILGKVTRTGINNPYEVKRGQRTLEFLIHYVVTVVYAHWVDKLGSYKECITLLAQEVYEIFDRMISVHELVNRVPINSLDRCSEVEIKLSTKAILQLNISNKSEIKAAHALVGIHRIPDACRLEELIAQNNSLCTLCSDIGMLHNLMFLKLGGNNLTALPDSFNQLHNLQLIDCRKNQFEEFPEILFTLKQLKAINFACNRLNNLPDSFNKTPELELINVSTNNLTKLPTSFQNLDKLKELIAFENQLQMFPKLKDLVNLISVGIDYEVYKKNKKQVREDQIYQRAKEDAEKLKERLKAVSLF